MHTTKTIVSFAVTGFVLSLIFGIFSNSGFFRVLFMALGWAAGFALLGFGVSFAFKTLLAVDNSQSLSQAATTTAAAAPSHSNTVGNNVDITIEDQELDRTESVNRYSVGQNHQMLNDSDLDASAKKESKLNDSVTPDNQGFIPVRNLETYKNFSGTESVKPSEVKSNNDEEELEEIEEIQTVDESAPKVQPASSGGGDLDVLPDMDEYVMEKTETNTNDGFGYDGSGISEPSYGNSKQKVDGENMQNTELIAKAISSVLSAET